jgi:2-polyprenyl-3-methyl-5-hydroxy-6-metoxy-1,4-benzoquinol methylase
MGRKGKNTLNTILQDEGESCPVATDASSTECRPLPATNAELKEKYDEMHSRGPGAWFSDGNNEREAILKMGEPWGGLSVLEVGCGEGDLLIKMADKEALVDGIDYSEEAIRKARTKIAQTTHSIRLRARGYRDLTPKFMGILVDDKFSRLVLQGVLEHLDNPFEELKWMMDNLLVDVGDVITSSPNFMNPRGLVWFAFLRLLGAVMSKTDLHFLKPKEFEQFCKENNYSLHWTTTDHSWANGDDMVKDFRQRIPLALRDAGVSWKEDQLERFLAEAREIAGEWDLGEFNGATAVYRITKEIH